MSKTFPALSASNLFFELLQVSIGARAVLSRPPTSQEWMELFAMSRKQTLVGICFNGVQLLYRTAPNLVASLPASCKMDWLAKAAGVQRRNEFMDKKTLETLAFFRENGFPCQVLKGQGIAALYGDLGKMRQSGDIDVWLAGGREKVYAFSRDVLGIITGANYHHIHFPIYKDVEIEAHVHPSFLSSPLRNRRFHSFCETYSPCDGGTDFPSLAFNRVFILLHCYRHLCGHGVGLRQLMDYYFVLSKGFTEDERKDTLHWCRKLGMGDFVKAVMWVMKNVFGLATGFLLCPPDAKEGEFLLSEIMHTGNMGHGETRYKWGQDTPLRRFVENQKRNLHLIAHYPSEVCWSPIFNIVRFLWLKSKGYK